MIKVFTDSTSYIPKELQEKYNIGILSLSVSLDDREYLEAETDNEEFFDHMSKSSNFPKSSQPSADAVRAAFEEEIKKGNKIVGVFLSSKMSGTFHTVSMVRNQLDLKYPDACIMLIDSKSNSMQLGLAALAAAEASAAGDDIDAVVKAAEETIMRTRFIFIPRNLKYLEKGGRIGRAQALLGNALKLIPILTVIGGETDTMAKVRTFKKATAKLIEILKTDIEKLGIDKLVISHINAKDKAKEILDTLKEFVNIEIVISNIGPVIGAHVGPGAIGLVYRTVEKHPMNV